MKLFGFPASVFFIVSNEFCERFSYYGMKAILILYLTAYIKLDQTSAITLSHGFNMICYLTPLAGAILADSYIGKFKTILSISIIYSFGNAVMAITAVRAVGSAQLWGPLVGLFLIGIGTGGIKPCVAAFGGDQFTEEDEGKLGAFFSLFYFAINAGSVLSMLITPYLRVVQCMGDACYSLAFGVPAMLMLVAICIFVMGDCITKYTKRTPEGNIFGDVCRCIFYALRRKSRASADEWRRHWLDWADDRYSTQLINDIKAVLNVFTVFIPLPIFWSLFEQQATRWTLQAQRLDGMGVLLPDQMGVMNALLILVFIPIFDRGVYPLLNKCGFAMRPLQRIGVGLLLTAASFVISGFLEVALEGQDLHPPPSGHGYVTVINNLEEGIRVQPLARDVFPAEKYIVDSKSIMGPKNSRIKIKLHRTEIIHGDQMTNRTWEHPEFEIVTDSNLALSAKIEVPNRKGKICVVEKNAGTLKLLELEEDVKKPPPGKVWINLMSTNPDLPIQMGKKEVKSRVEVEPGDHEFHQKGGNKTGSHYFGVGGTYTVVFNEDLVSKVYTNTEHNKYSMLWQIPQYIVITMGEIMVSVTGLSFAYSQAPESMKAVLQSGWLFTTFVGNLIVVIVTEASGGHGEEGQGPLKHSEELFLFAGLCVGCSMLFAFLATGYKYVNVSDSTSEPGSGYATTRVSPDLELHEIANGKLANGNSNVGYDKDD